jgi:DtxR family transcriptional regulator, Mn-dependent transcriptional regulator
VHRADDLIDTTEMYLRCVMELEEDGIIPQRARIAGRLGHSFPTVSQTVARIQRDGLAAVSGGRRIELTPEGRSAAVRVMRKHRLAECLLADVIGLDWPLVHEEACRWEHVISEAVERRVLGILGYPAYSPYGNPIPGIAELGHHQASGTSPETTALSELPTTTGRAVIRRFGEPIQSDIALLTRLQDARIRPGCTVTASRTAHGIQIGTAAPGIELDQATAAHIFVTSDDTGLTGQDRVREPGLQAH